jgi:predicted signal transduction protein with EAL and GGDEF domain
MVSHLVDIASSLGLEVVAEGVETEEQLRLLVKTGCQHIQGWFIGRAMPMEAFLSFVRSYNPSSLKGTPTVIDLASQIPDRASTRASGTLRSLR